MGSCLTCSQYTMYGIMAFGTSFSYTYPHSCLLTLKMLNNYQKHNFILSNIICKSVLYGKGAVSSLSVHNRSSWRCNPQLKTSEQFKSPGKWHIVIKPLVPDISRDCTAFIFEVLLSKEIDSMNQLTMKMRAQWSFEILASIYISTWHKLPEDFSL